MIYYFWESLKSFIKIEIELQNCILTSLKEIIQRIVNIIAKISLKSNIIF